MKRIMTITAALLFAVAAQAASIDWAVTGAGAIKNEAGTNVGSGWTVYLVLTSSLAGIEAAIKDGSFAGTYVDATTGTAGVLGSATTGAGSNIGASTPITISSPLLTAGTGYSYTVLYFNETYTGVDGSSGSYRKSATSATVDAYTGDTTTQVTFGGSTLGGSWNSYTVNVPEPTAMALLALGAAAVGLRRRFRA